MADEQIDPLVELIDKLNAAKDDTEKVTIYDDLKKKYSESASSASHYKAVSEAKIADMEKQLNDANDQMNKLKSTNYDLLMAAGQKKEDAKPMPKNKTMTLDEVFKNGDK